MSDSPLRDVDDDEALVEWVNALQVCSAPVRELGELADGELLLRVMHEAAPQLFPGPSSVHLWRLLEGLSSYFHGRHTGGEQSARKLLSQVVEASQHGGHRRHNAVVDERRLAELVVCGAIESEDRRRYVEACQALSPAHQQAIMKTIENFHCMDEATPGSPGSPGSPTAGVTGLLSSLRREAPQRGGGGGSGHRHAWQDDEVKSLRRELQDERERRQTAEAAERAARSELLLADEARDRVRDEQRALFELRLEQEVKQYADALQLRDEELARMRDELDVLRSQAGQADRLSSQLRECRRKLEELQPLRRANDELQAQLDEFMSGRAATGSVEHLHERLEKLRADAAAAMAERDSQEHQVQLLGEQLATAQRQQQEAKEEAAILRRDLAALRRKSIGDRSPASHNSPGGDVGLSFHLPESRDTSPSKPAQPQEASRSKLKPPPLQEAPGAMAKASAPSPKASGVEELRQLLHTQKDDLLERLLIEKERTTKAETTLQLQRAECERLKEQHSRDMERIGELEVAQSAADKTHSAEGQEAAGEKEARILELQDLVAQRDRELHVHRWRARSENESVAAQEMLMSGCFHELGLRYQKLRIQNEALKRKLQGE
eukprot:TRINITY_DN27194_c0_g1_i1.p1 TRINITY_DN27194_c0_g1~~TRINITY_DN27194_c0_g1_i1.p1  ORF type:complete len:609 (-),score=201.44 TRINITY_DN27194_c0_g1_i1:64-1890(-)